MQVVTDLERALRELGIPFGIIGALDRPLGEVVATVLDQFSDPEAAIIGVVARERGRVYIEDEERRRIFDHFRWYRLGAGL